MQIARPVTGIGKMKRADLEKAHVEKAYLRRKITVELALLRFAPEPLADKGSRQRMVVVILEAGLLENWPEDFQGLWYDHLQKALFD